MSRRQRHRQRRETETENRNKSGEQGHFSALPRGWENNNGRLTGEKPPAWQSPTEQYRRADLSSAEGPDSTPEPDTTDDARESDSNAIAGVSFEGYDPDDHAEALARFCAEHGVSFYDGADSGTPDDRGATDTTDARESDSGASVASETDTTDTNSDTDTDTDTMTMTTTDDHAEELAEAVLRAEDIREKNDKNLSAAEYLEGKYRLDASEYEDRYRLRRHLTDAKNDIPVAEQTVDAKVPTDGHLSDFAEQQRTGSATGKATQADKLARDHMTVNELRAAIKEDRTPAEHIRERYDIEAGDYAGTDHDGDDTEGLREALADARARTDMTGLPDSHDRHTTDMDASQEPLSPSNPGGVGEPFGLKGPSNPGNKHVRRTDTDEGR